MKYASNIKPASGAAKKSPRRRDSSKISALMQAQAAFEGHGSPVGPPNEARIARTADMQGVGLTLGQLEDCRWSITPALAREVLEGAGLLYEGRRAGNIYSWASIFRAEGIVEEVAKGATPKSHPELFDDLVDTTAAAELMGYQDSSSIRKKVAANEFARNAYVTFGRRGVYRLRPAMLTCDRPLTGKIL